MGSCVLKRSESPGWERRDTERLARALSEFVNGKEARLGNLSKSGESSLIELLKSAMVCEFIF